MNRNLIPRNTLRLAETTMKLPDSTYLPALGRKTDFRIGVVGAGGIVEAAHLPAYQKAGLRVAGIFDRASDRAERLARQFPINKVFRTLDELLLSTRYFERWTSCWGIRKSRSLI